MANTPVPVPERDDYCLITGVLDWTGGTAPLRKGERWIGDPRLLVERPDLFGSWLDLVTRENRPPVHKIDCRQCKQQFVPNTDSTQYCSKACRRDRETVLRRAVRKVNWRKWPSIPAGDSVAIRKHIDEIDERISLLHLLINHLGKRAYQYDPDPRLVGRDEVELKSRLTDGEQLLRSATEAFNRSHTDRLTAYDQLTSYRMAEESVRVSPAEFHNGMGYAIERWGNGPNPAWETDMDVLDEQSGVSSRGVAAAITHLSANK